VRRHGEHHVSHDCGTHTRYSECACRRPSGYKRLLMLFRLRHLKLMPRSLLKVLVTKFLAYKQRSEPISAWHANKRRSTRSQTALDTLTNGAAIRSHLCGAPFFHTCVRANKRRCYLFTLCSRKCVAPPLSIHVRDAPSLSHMCVPPLPFLPRFWRGGSGRATTRTSSRPPTTCSSIPSAQSSALPRQTSQARCLAYQ